MGQTLENSIYLPDEGETNCYSGLASNWRALDTLKGSYSAHAINVEIHVTAAEKETWNNHVADTVKHVTAEDKAKWDAVTGKADASALTAHTGDTTIHVTAEDKQAWNNHVADTVKHVTAEDKQAWNGHVADTVKHVTAEDKAKWDAVTSKADDSDVVHKRGNETKSGELTLENDLIFKGSTTPVIVTKSKIDLDTSGGNESISWAVKDKTENYNVFEQRVGKLSSQVVDYRLNIIARYNNNSYTRGVYLRVDPVNQAGYLNPAGNNLISLGMSTSRFSNAYTNKINNLEPSSLSLPIGNLNDIIDISSYLTVLDGSANTYVAPANGWITIVVGNCIAITCIIPNYWSDNRMRPTSGNLRIMFPILKNQTANILIFGGTIDNARFIPCQGNI